MSLQMSSLLRGFWVTISQREAGYVEGAGATWISCPVATQRTQVCQWVSCEWEMVKTKTKHDLPSMSSGHLGEFKTRVKQLSFPNLIVTGGKLKTSKRERSLWMTPQSDPEPGEGDCLTSAGCLKARRRMCGVGWEVPCVQGLWDRACPSRVRGELAEVGQFLWWEGVDWGWEQRLGWCVGSCDTLVNPRRARDPVLSWNIHLCLYCLQCRSLLKTFFIAQVTFYTLHFHLSKN